MKRHRDRQPGKHAKPLTEGATRSAAASVADLRQPGQPPTILAHFRASLAGRSRSATWIRGLLLGLLLAGGTIIAYHPVWHAGFVFDDDIHIRQNRMLFDPDGLKQIWTSLELQPLSSEAHNNLTSALRLTGRMDEALGHYRRAL